MQCQDIIKVLEELSPVSYAEDWDNVGLLVGRQEKEVTSVLLTLDVTDEVIEQAVKEQASMIIAHHPLLFRPLKHVTTGDFVERRVFRLIQKDINCYAMHTNFDVMGMADAVADELHIKDREVLDVTYEDDISREGIGRIGQLPKVMTLAECAAYVKEQFCLPRVRIFGDADTEVERVAICPGSGKSFLPKVVESGIDVYITGDIDHHSGLDAVAQGVCIIDAGHYGLEQIFPFCMKEYLTRKLPELSILVAQESEPFQVI